MPDEISYESVKDTLATATPAAKALAAVFQESANQYVSTLAAFFDNLGIRDQIPTEWVIQAVYSSARQFFGDMTLDEWTAIYVDTQALNKLIDEHPELIHGTPEEAAAKHVDGVINDIIDDVLGSIGEHP